MKKIIHHIRQQPEEIRRHILHVVVIIAGIVLLFLWVFSLGTSVSTQSTSVGKEDELNPFTTIRENVIGGYENIRRPNENTQ